MKRALSRLVLWLALITGGASHALSADPPLTIAVFEFQGADDASRELAPKISALLNADFSTDARLLTVEREEIAKVVGEQELALSGSISEATAAKAGNLLGARLLVTGKVMKLDRETIVIAKLISAETGRVFAEKAALPAAEAPGPAVTALAQKLAGLAQTERASLLAAGDNTEEAVAALKKSLAGKALPKVSVSIPEQHFGRPVIDPAAETELNLLLKQCGFELLDAGSHAKPEVEITGEAFSERAFQKGALLSCKARLEVKVRRVSDGVLLSADRQVSVAVDLAEHVAAKSALQAAARQIAMRILPAAAAR